MSILQTTIDKYEIKLLMHEGQGIRVYQASTRAGVASSTKPASYVVIKQAVHNKNTQTRANANIRHQISILEKLEKHGMDTGFVKLLEHGLDENECVYIVMPKYQHTLTRFLQLPDTNLNSIQLLDWIAMLSKYINNLHEVGFTHNDLKPDNLFINENRELVIGDLGAAQTLSVHEETTGNVHQTKTNDKQGTPAFASPELLYATRPVSGASDFYSIGKIAQYIIDAAHIDVPTKFHEFILRLAHEDIDKRLSDYAAIETNIEGLRHSLDDNRTQVLSDTWLTEKYASLYEKMLLMLSQNGQIGEADEAFLQNAYLGNMTLEQSSTILSSLKKCALDSLCKDPNMRDWLMWCETLNKQLEHRANRLTKGEFLVMTDDGIRLSKRNRYQVESYIRKRAKIIGTTRKRYWALAFILSVVVLCGLYFYEIKPNKNGDDATIEDQQPSSAWRRDGDDEGVIEGKNLPIQVAGGVHVAETDPIDKSIQISESLVNSENNRSETIKRLRLPLDSGEELYIDFVKIDTINDSIWVMQNEVPIVLYRACIDARKCRKIKHFSTQGNDSNQYEEIPVTNISWFDITEDFIPYLNKVFSTHFRLPTLSEWRAMSLTGELAKERSPLNMHCQNCNVQLSTRFPNGPVPANLLAVDDKNLRHVYGNVQEWLDECPLSKNETPLCYQAIVAGGSWMHTVDDILNNSIDSLQKRARSINTGFRLVESEK